jgi:hypothetical protein
MTGGRRAAAVIVRDGRVLMIRERSAGPSGRPDGQEYWTLLGGDDLDCDCPALVSLDWVPLPAVEPHSAGVPVPTMIVVWPV